jgi:DnaK suppressor protein
LAATRAANAAAKAALTGTVAPAAAATKTAVKKPAAKKAPVKKTPVKKAAGSVVDSAATTTVAPKAARPE